MEAARSLVLEAAKAWAMQQRIPADHCKVVHDHGSFEIRIDELASATVYKDEVEQHPGILQQFVGELLSRSYQENVEVFR